MLSTSQ